MEPNRDPREMICTSIRASTIKEMMEKALDAATSIIELRLDTLTDSITTMDIDRLREVVSASKQEGKKVILTYRNQGYRIDKTRILEYMIKAEPDYLDLDIYDDPIEKASSELAGTDIKIIGSYHDTERTPIQQELEAIVWKAEALGADIVKVITTARHITDNLVNMKLTSMKPSKVISFSMGPLGTPSRVLAPFFGAPFTYASYTRGEETAPGQIEAGEVIRIWRMLGLI